jgi:hypothetical protein
MHQTSWILGVLFLASGVGLVRFLAFGAGILCVAVWEGIKDGERKGKKGMMDILLFSTARRSCFTEHFSNK